jgi:hypothetical protein
LTSLKTIWQTEFGEVFATKSAAAKAPIAEYYLGRFSSFQLRLIDQEREDSFGTPFDALKHGRLGHRKIPDYVLNLGAAARLKCFCQDSEEDVSGGTLYMNRSST